MSPLPPSEQHPPAAPTLLDALGDTALLLPPEPVVAFTDEPKYPNYLCSPSERARRDYRTAGAFGIGIASDDATARARAAAECLERLCLFNPPPFHETRPWEGPGSQVDPRLFELPADRHPVGGDGSTQSLAWWPAENLVDGSIVLIPAQAVFLAGIPQGEMPLRPEWTSNGAAFGSATGHDTLERALCEVIERDAAACAYYSQRPLSRVRDLPPRVAEMIAYLDRYALESCLFDLTSEWQVPVIMAVVIDRTGLGPAVCVGSKASRNVEAACLGALFESIQSRRSGRWQVAAGKINPAIHECSEVIDAETRFGFWYHPQKIAGLRHWLESTQYIAADEIAASCPADMSTVIRRMAERGCHVFGTNVALPDVTAAGFAVWKVCIPELMGLPIKHGRTPIGARRIGGPRYDSSLLPHPWP